MAKDKVVQNGWKFYILEGGKLYLFGILFSLISFPGLAIPNKILTILFGLLCLAPSVVMALIMGKNAGVASYKQTRRVRADLMSDKPVMTEGQKFFAHHWAKGLIPAAVYAVPQLIFLLITMLAPNVVTRVLLLAPNMQMACIITGMGYQLAEIGAHFVMFIIPIVVIPAVYSLFYIMTGLVQRGQYMDIADEIRRFRG